MSPAEPYASLEWPSPIAALDAKRQLAAVAAGLVHASLSAAGWGTARVGLGSGSTAFLTLLALAAHREEFPDELVVVATSYEMEWYAGAAGFTVVPLDDSGVVVAFDGADQVDPAGALVKGRGGAMGHERGVLRAAARELIVVDPSKQVEELGGCPLPLALHPTGIFTTVDAIEAVSSAPVVVRSGAGKDGPVLTESGTVLADLMVPPGSGITEALDTELREIDGVLDTGYFAPSAKREVITG